VKQHYKLEGLLIVQACSEVSSEGGGGGLAPLMVRIKHKAFSHMPLQPAVSGNAAEWIIESYIHLLRPYAAPPMQ